MGVTDLITESGNTIQEGKWYSHDEDLKAFSLKHPDIVFEIKGYGEDNGDIWVKYFKNGKCQECPAIISFEKFDEKKLK